jgi:cobalt-precorrin 5A hydrolase
MALGIVVRVIGHYLKDKFHDPAIVVVDECARFAISTLSGHEGRANNLAYLIAGIIGAQPVITTASQTNKKFIIGLGCRDKIKKKEIIDAIKEALKLKSLDLDDVREVATIDLKANDKEIISACEELNIPVRIIPTQQIKNLTNIRYNTSELVKNKIGIGGVCEPCALLSGKNAKLILPKTILDRVTIAIAEENCM